MPDDVSRDLTWLLDILQEARRAREVVQNIEREPFLNDWRTQHVVARCLEIIGEAANRISSGFQAEHTSVSWSKMIGMRNIVIHHYHRVDYELVWDTLQEDIPELIRQIEPLIPLENTGH